MRTILEIKAIFDQISSESSLNKKKRILEENKNNDSFKKILKFLFDPFLITGISEKKINKVVPKSAITEFKSIYELMDYLFKNNTGSDRVIYNIQNFLSKYDKDLLLFYKAIITKTLNIGCDIKTINSVYGNNFINLWEVQQAYTFHEPILKKDEWFSLSEKLNGIRGTYYNGQIISRQGFEIKGLDHIIEEIKKLPYINMVFDGELIRSNPEKYSNNENFRLTSGIINSDNDKSNIKFVIFDMIPKSEFDFGMSIKKYKERYEDLILLKNNIISRGLTTLSVADVLYQGNDIDEIYYWLDWASEHDIEGLMLNRNYEYFRKRHNGILKVKKFNTIDLEIIGVQEGINEFKNKLGAFIVKYKNNKVRVGSGFTLEQREVFWANKDNLIGRIIEVKYKEETQDSKTGKLSLQFPIFLELREIGKKENYD